MLSLLINRLSLLHVVPKIADLTAACLHPQLWNFFQCLIPHLQFTKISDTVTDIISECLQVNSPEILCLESQNLQFSVHSSRKNLKLIIYLIKSHFSSSVKRCLKHNHCCNSKEQNIPATDYIQSPYINSDIIYPLPWHLKIELSASFFPDMLPVHGWHTGQFSSICQQQGSYNP